MKPIYFGGKDVGFYLKEKIKSVEYACYKNNLMEMVGFIKITTDKDYLYTISYTFSYPDKIEETKSFLGFKYKTKTLKVDENYEEYENYIEFQQTLKNIKEVFETQEN